MDKQCQDLLDALDEYLDSVTPYEFECDLAEYSEQGDCSPLLINYVLPENVSFWVTTKPDWTVDNQGIWAASASGASVNVVGPSTRKPIKANSDIDSGENGTFPANDERYALAA